MIMLIRIFYYICLGDVGSSKNGVFGLLSVSLLGVSMRAVINRPPTANRYNR
jgi:hypothetical protein